MTETSRTPGASLQIYTDRDGKLCCDVEIRNPVRFPDSTPRAHDLAFSLLKEANSNLVCAAQKTRLFVRVGQLRKLLKETGA